MSPKYKPCVHSSKRERKKSILYLLQRCPAVPWPPDLVATTAPRYTAPTFPPPFFLHPRERARGQTRTRTHSHPSSIKLYARNIFPAWECERKSNFNRAGISFRPEENAISLINIGKGRESHDKTYTPCVHGYIRRSGENKKETAHKKEGGGKEKKRKRWFFGPQVRGAHAWSCSFFKTFLLLLLLEIISETPEGPLRDLRTTPPGVPLASFIRKYYELTRSAQPVSMISCFRAIV